MIETIQTINNLERFKELVNMFEVEYNVFATQTHVTVFEEDLVYTAVLFHRGKKNE